MFDALRRLFRGRRDNKEAALAAAQERYLRVMATYDAARNSDDFRKYWANSDRCDADSAHSPNVRHMLIARSRYEIGNNGYADGIAQTYATDLVGVGPSLRMQTSSDGYNRMIEFQWYLWCRAVQLRRKLWCMAHAKHTDGESFGVLRKNTRVNHAIPLDIVLYEAEQVQSLPLAFLQPGRIDGVTFDEFGNPEFYELLRAHPGAANSLSLISEVERIPADRMLHWFKMRRPGQHRGVPESASTLNVGASSRRWREATVAAAESAADFSVLLETEMPPNGDADPVTPFSTQEIDKRMMVASPMGWKAHQMTAEHPNAQYEAFHKAQINEMARPKSMPYNKAACDSSSYNYASGRLDHQTYYGSLDVDRADCNERVLDVCFDVWFDLGIQRFGWLGGNPAAVGPGARVHLWDWPKHRVADVEAEANANQTKLKSGQTFPHQLFSDAGMDFEDELIDAAKAFGVTVDEMRTRLLNALYPQPSQPAGNQATAQVAALMQQLQRRQESLSPSGAN